MEMDSQYLHPRRGRSVMPALRNAKETVSVATPKHFASLAKEWPSP